MFLTICMHLFGWLSEGGGNFLNLLQKEGVARKRWVSSEKDGSSPGGNYDPHRKSTIHFKAEIVVLWKLFILFQFCQSMKQNITQYY